MNENYVIPEWNPKIPARYANAVYEDVPKNIQEVFERIKETRKGLYLHGSVGTGKTHIAYALFRNSVKKGKMYGKFWNTTELLREIRLDYDREAMDKRRIEEDLMKDDGILFLDDVGSEKITDWVLETFYLIINKRYNSMLPTIYTSNFSVGEIAERIGDKIASRIVETCEIINMEGVDRRLQK